MKTKLIGYIGVDSGAIVIGDAAINEVPMEEGPFREMRQFKLDAKVAQGFVFPTITGDGIFAMYGHFENGEMTAVTIELES
jgi:hypothetical protein